MNNLIDYTYFKGTLLIDNASGSYVQTALNALIAEKQEIFLIGILEDLYAPFKTWYEAGHVTNLYNDLLNGLGSWVGLKKPLACYVYYCYMRNNVTQTVSAGEVKTESQNSKAADMRPKMCAAWNQMKLYLDGYLPYMSDNYGTYGLWDNYTSVWRRRTVPGFYKTINEQNT